MSKSYQIRSSQQLIKSTIYLLRESATEEFTDFDQGFAICNEVCYMTGASRLSAAGFPFLK